MYFSYLTIFLGQKYVIPEKVKTFRCFYFILFLLQQYQHFFPGYFFYLILIRPSPLQSKLTNSHNIPFPTCLRLSLRLATISSVCLTVHFLDNWITIQKVDNRSRKWKKTRVKEGSITKKYTEYSQEPKETGGRKLVKRK